MGSSQGTMSNKDALFYLKFGTHGTITKKDNQFYWKIGNNGTITNKDNQFYWKIGNNVSVLARATGTSILSPCFYFEDESWQFVLEKVTPFGEPPHIADHSFLLKLTNQTPSSKAVFHVKLCVEYKSVIDTFTTKSDICKLDFRGKTAEHMFVPEYMVPWLAQLTSKWQKAGLKCRALNAKEWLFSCTIFKPNEEQIFFGTPYKEETPLTSAEKLQEDFKKLLIGGKNSDVVFRVDGRDFKAHRSILSARSDYFSAMFDHDTSEKQTGVVSIEDSDPDAFQGLLQYIYTGETCFSPVRVAIGLYTVADRYQVLELKEKCLKQIKSNLSIDSFCDVARMSLVHPELNLTEIISPYFTTNASDIVSTSEWETFMEENPKACNKLLCSTLKPTPKTHLHPLT